MGRLHFCGELYPVAFQASMEDAGATGAFTAQAVLHDMGLPTEHIMTALGVRLLLIWPSARPLQHGGAMRRFPQQFPQAS